MTTTVTVTVTVYDFPAPLMYLNTAYYPMDESSGNNREDSHTTGCPADASAFVMGEAQGDNPDFRLGPVMLWGRVLTAAEWTWLYNTGSGRTYAAIAAYTGD